MMNYMYSHIHYTKRSHITLQIVLYKKNIKIHKTTWGEFIDYVLREDDTTDARISLFKHQMFSIYLFDCIDGKSLHSEVQIMK